MSPTWKLGGSPCARRRARLRRGSGGASPPGLTDRSVQGADCSSSLVWPVRSAGVLVADFTRYLPGPFASRELQRLGARIVRVEPPGGDPLRSVAPGWDDGAQRRQGVGRRGISTRPGARASPSLRARTSCWRDFAPASPSDSGSAAAALPGVRRVLLDHRLRRRATRARVTTSTTRAGPGCSPTPPPRCRPSRSPTSRAARSSPSSRSSRRCSNARRTGRGSTPRSSR